MTTIIFDFDGTIANTFMPLVQVMNSLAPEFGYPPLSTRDLQRLRNLNGQQIARESGLSMWTLARLVRRVRWEMSQQIHAVEIFPGLETVLRHLARSPQLRLGIITSNSTANVHTFLSQHHLQDEFGFVWSEPSLFGKSRVIRRACRQYHLDLSRVIYVGDETRDLDAARQVPVQAIAVGWGFNTPDVLRKHWPDALASTPDELATIIHQIRV